MIRRGLLIRAPLAGYHRQEDVGWILRVAVNGLLRDLYLGIHALFVTSVGIPVPEREVAARQVDANAVSFQKDIAGG